MAQDQTQQLALRESALRDHFADNLAAYLARPVTVLGTEVSAAGAGRIDILAQTTDLSLLVIEIKAVKPSRDVIAQVQSYIGALRATEKAGKIIEGIVLAPDYDAQTIAAASVVNFITLYRFTLLFSMTLAGLDGAPLPLQHSRTRWILDVDKLTMHEQGGRGALQRFTLSNIDRGQGVYLPSGLIRFSDVVFAGDSTSIVRFKRTWVDVYR